MDQVFLPYTFLESEMIMKNLTTPQAILFGLGLIALTIASFPYSSNIVKPAHASGHLLGCNMDEVTLAIYAVADSIDAK